VKKIFNHCSFQVVSINVSKIHADYVGLFGGGGGTTHTHKLAILDCLTFVSAVPPV